MKKFWKKIKNFFSELFNKNEKTEEKPKEEPIIEYDYVDLLKYEEIDAPIFIKNDKGDYKINTNYWTVPKAGPSLWNKHAGLYPTYEENEDLIRFICKSVDTNEDGWATAAIKSKNDFCDGYFECYAKFTSGKSTWPAIWTTHPNGAKNNYETYYEVDLSEYYNLDNHTCTTYHCPQTMRGGGKYVTDVKTDIDKYAWNKYGMSWDKDSIKVYINDKIIMNIENDGDTTHFPVEDSTRTFQIILSMQYANKWLGTPDLGELPLFMDIKDFKIYKVKK